MPITPSVHAVEEILAARTGRSFIAALTPSLRRLVESVEPGLVDVFDSTFEAGVEFEAARIRASISGRRRPPAIDALQGAGPDETRRNFISLVIGISGNLLTAREIDPLITRLVGTGKAITGKEYFEQCIAESGLPRADKVRLSKFIEHDAILREVLERTVINVGTK